MRTVRVGLAGCGLRGYTAADRDGLVCRVMAAVTSSERALAFFSELMAGKPAKHPAYLWAKGLGTRYPLTPEHAAATTTAWLRSHAYVGVAFVEPGAEQIVGPTRRPNATDAAGIYGLWLDIDVNGTPDGRGGVKTGAAADHERALGLASAILAPTMTVHTGGGIHAWHLLAEPWLFDGDADREHAAELAARWQDAHRELVPWRIDATHDLARVLRIPGSINAKGAPPAAVRLLNATGARYTLAEVHGVVAHVRPRQHRSAARIKSRPSLGIELDQHALRKLYACSPTFARTWDHERDAHPDWSMSEYDLALCSIASASGWTDDQLAALITAHREHYGDDTGKARRQDYIGRTIARAAASLPNGATDMANARDANANGADPRRRVGPLATIRLASEPRDIVGQALDALILANDPPRVFVRGGELHRLVRDENARARLERMSEAALRVELERGARFLRVSGKNELSVPAPRNVIESVGALGEWPRIPAVEAIVEAPVLRADGTVLDTPGYDSQTRLVYDPNPMLRTPTIKSDPPHAAVEAALELLTRQLLVDFPFATQADQANALGLLLTPIVRHLLPLVPLAVIDAPRAGSGKGLLGAVASRIVTGRPAPVFPAPHDDVEWGKALTALLERGSTFIFIDEVGVLRSARLAAALTATEYVDRRLGKTEIIVVPQSATWIAAGNNVQLAGDLPRRAYRIRLDPKTARPWTRTGFRHVDLEGWVNQHRGELLGALLTLARAWHAAGCPAATVPVVGGFTEWAQTVGGILAYAGVEGFLANVTALYDANDEDANAWETLLRAMIGVFGGRRFTTGDLSAAIDQDAALQHSLPEDLADKRGLKSFRQVLGIALKRHVDTRHGDDGIHIVRAGEDTRNRTPIWRIAVDSDARDYGTAGTNSAHTAHDPRAHTRDESEQKHSRDSRTSAEGTQ
jgi:hypothetical protein